MPKTCARLCIIMPITPFYQTKSNLFDMKRILATLCISTALAPSLSAQNQTPVEAVKTFFAKMYKSDTTGMADLFLTDATLLSTGFDQQQQHFVSQESVREFIASIATFPTATLDERIYSYDVRISDNLATVTTDYTFFLRQRLSHCGINVFTLVQTAANTWKIASIADTRRRDKCLTIDASDVARIDIDTLLNQWHRAAAKADLNGYFDVLADDCIYLGTDETERWTKAAFLKFSQPYFDKGKAWDFKPYSRYIYTSDDVQTAWFEEKLDTWMGICRGSGVLRKTATGWQIVHYNLAVTVPNDLINGFIKLTGKGSPKPSKKK